MRSCRPATGRPPRHAVRPIEPEHDAPEFERRWNRFARSAGAPWRVDETYVKVRGEWGYLYRAVDRAGDTIDFRLSPPRDVAAAKAFFRKGIKGKSSSPRTVILDGYAASHRAVREHGR
jgi:transposase-like protein